MEQPYFFEDQNRDDTPGIGEWGDDCPHPADSEACKAWHGPGFDHVVSQNAE